VRRRWLQNVNTAGQPTPLEAVEMVFRMIPGLLHHHEHYYRQLLPIQTATELLMVSLRHLLPFLEVLYGPFMESFSANVLLINGVLHEPLSKLTTRLRAQLSLPASRSEPLTADFRASIGELGITSFDSLYITIVQRLPRYLLMLHRLAAIEPAKSGKVFQSIAHIFERLITTLDAVTTEPSAPPLEPPPSARRSSSLFSRSASGRRRPSLSPEPEPEPELFSRSASGRRRPSLSPEPAAQPRLHRPCGPSASCNLGELQEEESPRVDLASRMESAPQLRPSLAIGKEKRRRPRPRSTGHLREYDGMGSTGTGAEAMLAAPTLHLPREC
jgi:hypothetical protein